MHYAFKTTLPNEAAKVMRARLCPVAAQIARLVDNLSGTISRFSRRRRRERERERAFDLMARAMAFAFEGEKAHAQAILDELEAEITLRRDSKHRMYYVFANTYSFLLIASIGVVMKSTGSLIVGPPLQFGPEIVVIDVLLFGALGAFFSVVYDIKGVTVHHAITTMEMFFSGAVRIFVGVIAAAVVILLVGGGWMLGGLGDSSMLWSVLLLGFSAGFAERLVPNALKNVEERTNISRPGASGGRAPREAAPDRSAQVMGPTGGAVTANAGG